MLLSERLKCVAHIDSQKRFTELVEKMSAEENLVIFGAGNRARLLGRILLEKGCSFNSFWVDKQYFTNNQIVDFGGQKRPVKCFEEELSQMRGEGVLLLLGVSKNMLDMDKFKNSKIKSVIPLSVGIRRDYLMSYAYYQARSAELDELYQSLADEHSRECLYAHLLGRLTAEDIDFVPSPWSDPQYILDDLMCWREHECFVDCGAYDGDSTEEFLQKIPDTVQKYSIYAIEANRASFGKLSSKFRDDPHVITVNKGVYSRKGIMGFCNDGGEGASFCEGQGETVAVDTIDAILGKERATFIKMDVEGAEMEALRGAEKQIRRYKPRLAVCVYHKQEDLSTIPQYIRKLNPDYKFYLRTHSALPTELTLYCI